MAQQFATMDLSLLCTCNVFVFAFARATIYLSVFPILLYLHLPGLQSTWLSFIFVFVLAWATIYLSLLHICICICICLGYNLPLSPFYLSLYLPGLQSTNLSPSYLYLPTIYIPLPPLLLSENLRELHSSPVTCLVSTVRR